MPNWARWIDRLEAIFGLLATVIIGYLKPVILFLLFANNQVPQSLAGTFIAFIALPILLMLPLIALAIAGLRDCFPEALFAGISKDPATTPVRLPLAVVMTIRLPTIPWLFRPLLSLWWFAHFACGAGVGFFVFTRATNKVQGDPVTRIIIPVLLDFSILFASNLYLLLAVAVLLASAVCAGFGVDWRCPDLVVVDRLIRNLVSGVFPALVGGKLIIHRRIVQMPRAWISPLPTAAFPP